MIRASQRCSNFTRVCIAVATAFIGTFCLAGHSLAADPASALSEAEAKASESEAKISELEDRLATEKPNYSTAAKRAVSAHRVAVAAKARAESLRSRGEAKAEAARQEIAKRESRFSEEEDDHEDEVTEGIASALAALAIAFFAFAWGWFRASASVAWLTEQRRAQAIGLCVGIGLFLIVIGGALLGSKGALAVIGGLIGFLGFILPTAFLLARHSAEVQRGRAKPLFKRQRLPRTVTLSIAALFAVLAVISLATSFFAEGPDGAQITAELREQAEGSLGDDQEQQLQDAEAQASRLASRAEKRETRQRAAHKPLLVTMRRLKDARRQLASATGDARFYSNRLAALEEEETRGAEREEEVAAEEAEEEAAEECNPNYSGCLDPLASDYDCEGGSGDGPLYTGTVEVTGYDEYELDDDGDGIGCDP